MKELYMSGTQPEVSLTRSYSADGLGGGCAVSTGVDTHVGGQ